MSSANVDTALAALAEIRKLSNTTPALKTLKVLVGNIAKSPTEEKYHCIKLTNPKIQERLGSSPQNIVLLKALGFFESDGQLKITPQTIDSAVFVSVLTKIEEAVEARDGTLKRDPLAVKKVTSTNSKKRPAVSMKQEAREMLAKRQEAERAQRLSEKQSQLKQIAADKHTRKHDPNWKSGVSAAAGKGGKSIETFRDKFGEGGGS